MRTASHCHPQPPIQLASSLLASSQLQALRRLATCLLASCLLHALSRLANSLLASSHVPFLFWPPQEGKVLPMTLCHTAVQLFVLAAAQLYVCLRRSTLSMSSPQAVCLRSPVPPLSSPRPFAWGSLPPPCHQAVCLRFPAQSFLQPLDHLPPKYCDIWTQFIFPLDPVCLTLP